MWKRIINIEWHFTDYIEWHFTELLEFVLCSFFFHPAIFLTSHMIQKAEYLSRRSGTDSTDRSDEMRFHLTWGGWPVSWKQKISTSENSQHSLIRHNCLWSYWRQTNTNNNGQNLRGWVPLFFLPIFVQRSKNLLECPIVGQGALQFHQVTCPLYAVFRSFAF